MQDSRAILTYAELLWKHLKDEKLADRYFREAIKLEPNSYEPFLAYARFLQVSLSSSSSPPALSAVASPALSLLLLLSCSHDSCELSSFLSSCSPPVRLSSRTFSPPPPLPE